MRLPIHRSTIDSVFGLRAKWAEVSWLQTLKLDLSVASPLPTSEDALGRTVRSTLSPKALNLQPSKPEPYVLLYKRINMHAMYSLPLLVLVGRSSTYRYTHLHTYIHTPT